MTGSRWPLVPGDQTLRVRQSSENSVSGGRLVADGSSGNCIAAGPNRRASRISLHTSGGRGRRKRSGPTGAAPYGTPRKILVPSISKPRILPAVVCTTGPDAALSMPSIPPFLARIRKAGPRPEAADGTDEVRTLVDVLRTA